MAHWRDIVASSIDWEQAHASFDTAVDKLPARARGRRPKNMPHSVWELVEHIRLAQADLYDFMTNPRYTAPKWPDDYWPKSPAPPSNAAWANSLQAFRRDGQRLKRFTAKKDIDLTKTIPWGTGQTYLRTILVTIDHTSHHVGQIIDVRHALRAWRR